MEALSEQGLRALYPETPSRAALDKVSDHVTPHYRAWIEASPFCALGTVGPEGLDCSPRGDAGTVVTVKDSKTLVLPDRRGNNRIDSLLNIVRDPRVTLMFLVPGSATVMRVNGQGIVTVDAELLAQYNKDGRLPRSAVVVSVDEVYFQCARAIHRAGLWSGADAAEGLPTPGAMLQAITNGAFDGKAYDIEWPDRAAKTMW